MPGAEVEDAAVATLPAAAGAEHLAALKPRDKHRAVGLRNVGQIGQLKIHPKNPDIAYVAAIGSPFGWGPDRGVYRTKDGGKTWQKVLSKDADTGASDVALDPQNPSIVFAGLWQALDAPTDRAGIALDVRIDGQPAAAISIEASTVTLSSRTGAAPRFWRADIGAAAAERLRNSLPR